MKVLINSISKVTDSDSVTTLLNLAYHYTTAFPNDDVLFLAPDTHAQFPLHKNPSLNIATLKRPLSPFFKNTIEVKKIHAEIRKFQPDAILTVHPLGGTGRGNVIFFPPSSLQRQTAKQPHASDSLKTEIIAGIARSSKTIVFSESEKQVVTNICSGSEAKVNVLYRMFPHPALKMNHNEQQEIMQKYTGSNAYFFCCTSDEGTAINILKGFSGFKKWQRSHMRLILSPEQEIQPRFDALLSAYRFKNDVTILPAESPDTPKAIASAYAVLMPEKLNSDFELAVTAINAEVSLIIPNGSIYSEVIREGAFYFNFQDKDDITRVFLASFREETRRAQMIRSASALVSSLSENNFSTNLRKLMCEV